MTNEAHALWSRIAAGEKGADLDAWIQQVARELVAKVFTDDFDIPARRADAAQKAVGFRGRRNAYAEFDALVNSAPEDAGYMAQSFADGASLVIEPEAMPIDPKRRARALLKGKTKNP